MIGNSIREALSELYDQQMQKNENENEQVEEIVATVENATPAQEENNENETKDKDLETVTENNDEKEIEESEDKKIPSYISKEYLNSYQNWNEEAKNYIAKREKDIASGFAKQDEMREFGRKASSVFKKYENHLSSLGIADPISIIDPLLSYEKVLRTGSQEQKVNAIKNLLQEYKIDVNYLSTDHQLNNNSGYDSELHNLRQELEFFKQEQQKKELQPYERMVENFIEKNPILKDPKIQNTVNYILSINADEYKDKEPLEALADASDKALAAFGIAKPFSASKQTSMAKQNVQKAKQMAISPKAEAGNKSSEPEHKTLRQAIEYAINKQLS